MNTGYYQRGFPVQIRRSLAILTTTRSFLTSVTTRICKTIHCVQPRRHFQLFTRKQVFLSTSRGTYTRRLDPYPRSISLLPSRGVHKTMSTASFLSSYLSEQKTQFLADGGNGWTIVMGNEAGDLDSLASSIGFAWLLSHVPTAATKAIALITTPREDFPLRAENLYALELVGIKESFHELLCPEDLPKANPLTTFALVDHNSLHPFYAVPGARVTAIVDHHEDEGKYLDTSSPRIIEPAGSCASLVTRLITSYPTLEIPPELAALLLSAIVIDTHGLRKGGKALGVDYEASTWLLSRVNTLESQNLVQKTAENSRQIFDQPWIQSLSKTLSDRKFALAHLTTRDLLRRDYKEYELNLSASICGDGQRSVKAGLSAVPLPLSTFFSPSPTSVVVAIREWIKERDLSILGVLTSYKSKQGHSRRELVWLVDENVCGAKLPRVFFDGFEASEVLQPQRIDFGRYGFASRVGSNEDVAESHDDEGSIREETSPFGVGLVARVYKQKNTSATRKQVAPVLKRVLEI